LTTVLSFYCEAGPCGYGLHRLLIDCGHDCVVVALSLLPIRRDALAAIGRGSVHEQEGGFRLGMVAIDMDDEFPGRQTRVERELRSHR
jgi:hypothetical protein